MKKTRIILFLGLVMLLGQACKKNSVEEGPYLGTAICASESFDYVNGFLVNGSLTPAAVDFRSSFVTLTADLNEVVTWTVTITGNTSQATKTYTQTSKTVNIRWYGNADGGEEDGDLFFKTGESVRISFTPSCKESKVISMTITDIGSYNAFGTLLYDFDGAASVYKYNNVDPNIGPWVRNVDTLLSNPSPQGGNCHKMYAPAGHSGWYIGGFGQACDLTSVLGANLVSDSVFINAYIHGTTTPGELNNTTVTLDMVETVGADDYHFKKNIVINWTGWKMVSFPLTALYIGNPVKVKSLDFSVGPNTYNGKTEAYIDFVIFTKGKPFLGPN